MHVGKAPRHSLPLRGTDVEFFCVRQIMGGGSAAAIAALSESRSVHILEKSSFPLRMEFPQSGVPTHLRNSNRWFVSPWRVRPRPINIRSAHPISHRLWIFLTPEVTTSWGTQLQ